MTNAERQKKYRANLVNVKSSSIEQLRVAFEISTYESDLENIKKHIKKLKQLQKELK